MEQLLKQIMLIDDNEIDNLVSTRMLNIHCFTKNILATISAESALVHLNELIKRGDGLPDLILLDLNMDIHSGYFFLERFKSFDPSVREKCKIVVLSSSHKEEDFNRIASEPLVLRYFKKPLSKNAIDELKTLL